MHGVDGVIRLRTNTGTSTADHQIVTLTRNGELEQEFQVGSAGHFYLENIAAGDYKGVIKTAERSCSFALTVPDTQEIVFTLQGDLVCEPNP
jgi:outer membrane usher protein FimD/PapC